MADATLDRELDQPDGDLKRSITGRLLFFYVLATTGPSDQGPPSEPGFINGGMLERGLPVGGPVLVVDVEDIDATLQTVERLGGTTVSSKQPVGEMGFSAYFKDSEGNLMGLWQNG